MNPPRDARLGLGLALVLAMVGVFAGYYLVHKPITPGQALAFAATAGNLAITALLTGLGGGLGRRVLRWRLSLHPVAPGVRAVLSVALGWGLLGLGVLSLGLGRLLHAAVLWGGVLLLLVWLWREVRAWAGDVAAALRGLAPVTPLDRLAALYLAVALVLGLLQAAAPPLKWDALVYHLALPMRYAQSHGVRLPLSDFSLFTGMPQLGEMLYTAAQVLRLDPSAGTLAAQLLGWAGGAVLALGLAAAAAEQGLSPWIAPAILFSSLSVAASLAWGYVELFLMLLALAMLLALHEWRRGGQRAWLALAGVMGGLAFSCKYTGLIVPLGGLAVVAHTLWRCPELRRARGGGLVPGGVFLLGAGVVAAPWLVKNWALTGSPIYPLLIPAADMDAARLWFYNRPDRTEGSFLRAALIYWRAAFLGVQGGNDYDVTLGPLLVLLPAALLVGWRWLRPAQRAPLAQWALFVGVAYAAWVALVLLSTLAEQARLFFAVLPALALLGAGGWAALHELNTPALRVSVVMGAGLALALGLSALELANQFMIQQPLPYLAGLQSRQDYEVARLGGYPLAMQAVNHLAPGSRVLFLWEARSLGCAASVTCVPDVIIDRWWHLRQSGAAGSEILRAWQAAGVTHLLLYETGRAFVAVEAASPFRPADWVELEALRAELGAGQAIGDAYTLYALP